MEREREKKKKRDVKNYWHGQHLPKRGFRGTSGRGTLARRLVTELKLSVVVLDDVTFRVNPIAGRPLQLPMRNRNSSMVRVRERATFRERGFEILNLSIFFHSFREGIFTDTETLKLYFFFFFLAGNIIFGNRSIKRERF